MPSIRLRLTIWYSGVLFLMLVVYAATTYFAVRHEFFEQLEDQLHDDFESAEAYLVPAADGRIDWASDRYRDPDEDADKGVDVWAAGGEPIYRSGASTSLPPVPPSVGRTPPRYESLEVNGRTWRTFTGTTLVGGRSVVMRVSRSEDRLRGQLGEILVVLALGLPLVVVLAGVGGYMLASRALAPIDHLATEARRITAERLHERLSAVNAHDEIGRLTAVINDTYGRLEASFEQLRRFTADASHELRTPLAVIRGLGETTLKATRTATEYKDAIGSMLEEIDRLSNLVDTLLRLSYGDAGTVRLSPTTVDLADLARDVAASLGVLAEERRQRLDVEAPEPVLATVDRLVVREALTNIVDNAIKYAPSGSSVTMRVYGDRERAIVEVIDEGPGIAPANRERIFDRFFRVDEGRSRESGGTGLGLSIAKWAVEVNGGRISVENGASAGSIFRVDLPRGAASVQLDEVPARRWSVGLALVVATTIALPRAADSPLTQLAAIELPRVEGRIDHLAFDASTQRLYVAALGNNSVEVVDTTTRAHVASVPGFAEPQGIALVPDRRIVAVANGRSGRVEFINADNQQRGPALKLGDDADNARYDAHARRLYVGFGDGAIAAIDPEAVKLLAQASVGGHPESFQLERAGTRLFVNVPARNQIAVIDRAAMKVMTTWPVTTATANFPMALDEANHRLFIGCRRPAKALVYDTNSGREVSSFDIVGDTDDLFYDPARKRLYVSGGEGFLDAIEEPTPNRFVRIEHLATAAGARTSLFAADQRRLYLAVPHRGSQRAEIRVYDVH